jgi:hypothetical protein
VGLGADPVLWTAALRPCTSFKAAVAIPENGHSVSFGEKDFSVRDPKKSQACFQSVRVDDVAGRRRDQQAAFITASVGLQIEPGELLDQEVDEQPPANRQLAAERMQ